MQWTRTFAVLAAAIPAIGWAAEPASGTLTQASATLAFVSGPTLVSDPVTASCPESSACDHYDLTVTLPDNFASTNPSATIKVYLTAQVPSEDYDLYVLSESGEVIGNSGNAPPSAETVTIPAGQGTTVYGVEVLAFAAAGGSADVTIALEVPEESAAEAAPQPQGLAPRFAYLQSPNGVANGAGEPTLGVNPFTGRALMVAGLEVGVVTFPEDSDRVDARGEPLPASCEPEWVSSNYAGNVNSLDPILETAPATGRTFQSQLSGANSIFSYTDDDGENWQPGQVGPPNGGADHQTVGTGPYSPNFVGVPNPEGYAVYYCSQSVTVAFCARSDDSGLTFGAGVPIYNPSVDCSAGEIGALHGHVQVANDGTVYVPFGECNGEQAVSVSEDSGLTWEVRPVPGTTPGDDPGVGIGADGTVYFCYVNDADGQPRATVSHDRGLNWENDRNLAAHVPGGIATAVFATATAGDDDRAACAWLGTDDPSPAATASNSDFPGIWYPYVSVTYDGGNSWHTVNVSPADPVQGAGGICLDGTTCGSNRNLLDFNDITKDAQGRVLFGHADGCIGTCVADPSKNTFSDNAVIARQTGGRTLFSAFDNVAGSRNNATQVLPPAAACLREDTSIRTAVQAKLNWNAPDNGGVGDLQYEVLRATSPNGPFESVGTTAKTSFVDDSADPSVPKYYYAVRTSSSAGTAPMGNVVEFPVQEEVVVDTCTLPGDTIILDALGDGSADDTDIEFVAVAEPPDLEGAFAITYKVATFTAGTPPPSTFYPILFQGLRGANRYIALDVSTGLPRHVYGTYEDVSAGVLVFTEEGTLDARSSVAADGTIVHVVPREFFGDNLVPGTIISGFDARSRAGAQSATSRDTAGPSSYIVRGIDICAPGGEIFAKLEASAHSGEAPLDVTFSVSGDSSDGGALDHFTLEFGDGQSVSNRSFSGQDAVSVTHTYTHPGAYAARLTVTDGAGETSANRAEQVVEVTEAAAPDGGGTPGGSSHRSGGALGGGALLLLGLAALRRRRR